ncbi:MAG: hypothetical protein V1726_02750 [Methanobacteriota archaeon]
MTKKKPVCLGVIFCCILGVFSGCTYLMGTTFTVISTVVCDQDGIPGLQMNCNTSDLVTLTFSTMEKEVLFTDSYYKGSFTVFLPLDSYRITPEQRTYQFTVVDQYERQIFHQTYQFNGGNLSIKNIKGYWSTDDEDDTTLSLVGLNITVFNQGDIPMYPHTVEVEIIGKQTTTYLLPTVILPGQQTTLCCSLYLNEIPYGDTALAIILKDLNDKQVCSFTSLISPEKNNPVIVYDWNYKGQRHLRIPIADCLYEYYHNLPRFLLEDYAAYVFDPYDDDSLAVVAGQLVQELGTYSEESEQVNAIASFVQSMDYVIDDINNASYEYPRYPVEMVYDQQGDCEDKAILLSSLLHTLGYNVSLLRLPNHMAVGVHLENELQEYSYFISQYYYLESTRTQWMVGDVPPEYKDTINVTVYPIIRRPLLVHHWKNATRYTGRDGTDFVKIQVLIQNIGTADATNVEVKAAFFSEDTLMFNQESSTVLKITPQEKVAVSLKVTVPQGMSTLLKTRLYTDRKLVDEKESMAWFVSKGFSE